MEMLFALDLGNRDIRTGFVDSVDAIACGIRVVGQMDWAIQRALDSDIADIRGTVCTEVMADILADWEDRASEYGLFAFAEEGTYFVYFGEPE